MKKKHDPEEKFEVWSFSRKEIAESLNEAIENSGSKIEPFEPDDKRLTAEVCRDIADTLNDGVLCQLDDIVDAEHQTFQGLLETFE